MKYAFVALGALIVVCTGCAGIDSGASLLANREHVAPPASMMARPGPMVDGPGPGVLGMLASAPPMGGDMGMGMGGGMAGPAMTTQVKFLGPTENMMVGWQVGSGFATNQIASGQIYDFQQGAIYQLVLDGVGSNQSNTRLYPTLEVRYSHPNTMAYLQHANVPVEINEKDLQHIDSSNMITKVIYLPDPEFQARAIAGVETLVSTTLDPGIDPVQKAEEMGTIMLIVRFGNKDLQPAASAIAANGEVTQVSYNTLDGTQGQVAPPTPIGFLQGAVGGGVPSAMIAAGGGIPGQPTQPVAGMGSMPPWGMPITGTPIGLPGPASLPLGGPAGLKSHTIRNLSKNRMPDPTDHLLIDVKHNPGYSLPDPVRHIQYTEDHPVHAAGEVSHPASSAQQIYGF